MAGDDGGKSDSSVHSSDGELIWDFVRWEVEFCLR